MITIEEFFQIYGDKLGLSLVTGERGLYKQIKVPEVFRPGLSLAGYWRSYSPRHILIFGRVEIEYLRDLEPKLRVARLKGILGKQVPAVIVARRFRPLKA